MAFNVTTLLLSGKINAVGAMIGNSKWGYLDIYANRSLLGDQSGDSTRAFAMMYGKHAMLSVYVQHTIED